MKANVNVEIDLQLDVIPAIASEMEGGGQATALEFIRQLELYISDEYFAEDLYHLAKEILEEYRGAFS